MLARAAARSSPRLDWSGCPRRARRPIPYAAIKSQISISGQDVTEHRVANHAEPSFGRKLKAMPGAPGCPDPTTGRTIKRVGKTDPLSPPPRGPFSAVVDSERGEAAAGESIAADAVEP